MSRSTEQLLNTLAGHRVYIDSCVLIYFLERDALRFELASALLSHCANQGSFAFTGAVALAEVMVKPHRAGENAVIAQTTAFFGQSRFLNVCEHSIEQFKTAAQTAGEQKMKLIDALHYTTALQNGCNFLVTNDRAYKSNSSMTVIQMDSIISQQLL